MLFLRYYSPLLFTCLLVEGVTGQQLEVSQRDARSIQAAMTNYAAAIKSYDRELPRERDRPEDVAKQKQHKNLYVSNLGIKETILIYDDLTPAGTFTKHGEFITLTVYEAMILQKSNFKMKLKSEFQYRLGDEALFNSLLELDPSVSKNVEALRMDRYKYGKHPLVLALFSKSINEDFPPVERPKSGNWSNFVACWIWDESKSKYRIFAVLPLDWIKRAQEPGGSLVELQEFKPFPTKLEKAGKNGAKGGSEGGTDRKGSGALWDTDEDGVPDREDHCDQDPGGPNSVNGCPDRDKDGWADFDLKDKSLSDQCPDSSAKGPGSWRGCPDRDGDEWPDTNAVDTSRIDDCPDKPWKSTSTVLRGCPPDTTTKKVFAAALDSIAPIMFKLLRGELEMGPKGKQLKDIDQKALQALFWEGGDATIWYVHCPSGKPQQRKLREYISALEKKSYAWVELIPDLSSGLQGYQPPKGKAGKAIGYLEFLQDFKGAKPDGECAYCDKTLKRVWIIGKKITSNANGEYEYEYKFGNIEVVRCQ